MNLTYDPQKMGKRVGSALAGHGPKRKCKPPSELRLKISVSMDISVLVFYGYIGYIRDISVDIFL